jgi:hypothetical protein
MPLVKKKKKKLCLGFYEGLCLNPFLSKIVNSVVGGNWMSVFDQRV